MPIGILVDCASVFVGGLIGWRFGAKLRPSARAYLTIIFGFCAMAIGVNSIVKAAAMTPVVLALVLGSLLGELMGLEDGIQRLAGKAVKRLPAQGDADMDGLMAAIVLFCFSGFGIYGVLLSAMGGGHATLFSKAVLDCATALVFAITLGAPVMLVSLPMLAIMLALFLLGKLLAPLMTDTMLRDFMACGGVLTLATGLRVAGIKHSKIANMIPALALVLPLSALWSLLPL